jgi:acylphosphatase
MPEKSRVHVVVRGVVQGVGYRYFAVDEARDRSLAGWVRNLPDGSVEATVEGESGLVEEFIARLRIGPPSSRVTAVQVQRERFAGEFDSFTVRN